MDVVGLIDGCGLASAIAAIVVIVIALGLYSGRPAGLPAARVRRAMRVVLAVAVLVQSGTVILSAVGDSRNIALRLEETETKLRQMEDILQDHEKLNQEMVSNLAAMLSKNPGNIKKMSYNKARSPDGTKTAELTITMKHADDDQPPADVARNDTEEIMEEATKHNVSAMGEAKQKPWRYFLIPRGHVFVLDCAGDELRVHIRPPSPNLDEELRRGGGTACGSLSQRRQQAFLYDYGSHRTLFVSAPGDGHVVPIPWPRAEMYQKFTAAVVKGEESPAVKEQVVPESFRLSPDVVMFYQPVEDGMTELLVSAADSVEYKELAEEVVAQAGRALTLPTILSASFPDVYTTQ